MTAIPTACTSAGAPISRSRSLHLLLVAPCSLYILPFFVYSLWSYDLLLACLDQFLLTALKKLTFIHYWTQNKENKMDTENSKINYAQLLPGEGYLRFCRHNFPRSRRLAATAIWKKTTKVSWNATRRPSLSIT